MLPFNAIIYNSVTHYTRRNGRLCKVYRVIYPDAGVDPRTSQSRSLARWCLGRGWLEPRGWVINNWCRSLESINKSRLTFIKPPNCLWHPPCSTTKTMLTTGTILGSILGGRMQWSQRMRWRSRIGRRKQRMRRRIGRRKQRMRRRIMGRQRMRRRIVLGGHQMRRRIVLGGHQMRSHLCQLPWILHQFLRPRSIHHQVSWHFSLHILHFSILLVHLDCFKACTVIPVSKDWVAGTEWFVHSSSEDRCQAGPRRIDLFLDFLLAMALDRTWSLRRREECIRRCLSLLHLLQFHNGGIKHLLQCAWLLNKLKCLSKTFLFVAPLLNVKIFCGQRDTLNQLKGRHLSYLHDIGVPSAISGQVHQHLVAVMVVATHLLAAVVVVVATLHLLAAAVLAVDFHGMTCRKLCQIQPTAESCFLALLDWMHSILNPTLCDWTTVRASWDVFTSIVSAPAQVHAFEQRHPMNLRWFRNTRFYADSGKRVRDESNRRRGGWKRLGTAAVLQVFVFMFVCCEVLWCWSLLLCTPNWHSVNYSWVNRHPFDLLVSQLCIALMLHCSLGLSIPLSGINSNNEVELSGPKWLERCKLFLKRLK